MSRIVDLFTRAALGGEVRAGNPMASTAKGSSGSLATVNRYSPGQAVASDYSAQVSVNNAYLADIYVHRCVKTISDSIGALEIRAGKDPEAPTDFRVNSPLATLLGPAPGSPNPQMSAAQLVKLSVASYLIMGKFAWEKVYDAQGRVNGLWPLQAQYLDPIPNSNPASPTYFSSYKYLLPGMTQPKIYAEKDIVYVWRPSIADFRQPESVIQAANLNISVHRLIEQYEYAFLKNNATPSTMVVTTPFAEPEQRRGFRDQFVSEFAGVANAGKTMFLESTDEDFEGGTGNASQGLSVTRLGSTAQEMQMDNMRDSKVRDICVAFRVPLSVLGDSSLAKFTNMQQDWQNFWRGTLLPLINELEDALNIGFAQDIGDELLWFDISGIPELREESGLTPAEIMPFLLSNLIDEDEARAVLGFQPREDKVKSDHPITAPPTATPGVFGMPADLAAEQVAKGALQAKPRPDVPAFDGTKPPALPVGTGQPADATQASNDAALAADGISLLATARSRRARQRGDERHPGHDGHLPIPGGHIHAGTTNDQHRKAIETLLTHSVQALFAEHQRSIEGRLTGRRGRRAQVQAFTVLRDEVESWEQRWIDLLDPLFDSLADDETRASYKDTATKLGRQIALDTYDQLSVALAGYDGDPTNYLAGVADIFTSGPQQVLSRITNEIAQMSASAA